MTTDSDSNSAIPKITRDDEEAGSGDLARENVERLKALFPQIVADGKVDFDVLRQLLGDEVEEGEERYGLNWKGKRRARAFAMTPSLGTLRPVLEDSVDWESTQNIMIEGDNLEVLKLLRRSYAGKVKLIYIDPPYNTAGDFVYNDNYRDTLGSYLSLTGQLGEVGENLTSNREERGRMHTEWLRMMYPRLLLAKEYLIDGGVVAISINDIEAPNLRLLCDEIFGSENLVAQLVWNNEGNVDQQSKIKGVHEYIVCYSNNAESMARPSIIDPNIEETSKLYNDTIENSITKNGPANPPSRVVLPAGFPASFEEGEIQGRTDKWPKIHGDVSVVGGELQQDVEFESGWSSRNLLDLFIKNGFQDILDSEGKATRFAVTPSGAIYIYKSRAENQGHVLSVIRNVGTTKQNSSVLKRWGLDFTYPKPVLLIQYLIKIFSQETGDIVFDFFAGSGTTGHALFQANGDDGRQRRLILVQLPETIAEGTIADLTIKRLSKAGEYVAGKSSSAPVDTGFRVYKLSASNLKPWQPDPDNLEASILDAVDNVLPDRTEEDLLVELLLKTGIDLTMPEEKREIAGQTVHALGGGALMVCLGNIADNQAEELGQGMADWVDELDPAQTTVYFKDSGIGSDGNRAATKANLAAILRQRLRDRIAKIASI